MADQPTTCAFHKKACYPSRDAAYTRRRIMGDRQLYVYPCKKMSGVFHLGHRDGLGQLLRLERAAKRRTA